MILYKLDSVAITLSNLSRSRRNCLSTPRPSSHAELGAFAILQILMQKNPNRRVGTAALSRLRANLLQNFFWAVPLQQMART